MPPYVGQITPKAGVGLVLHAVVSSAVKDTAHSIGWATMCVSGSGWQPSLEGNGPNAMVKPVAVVDMLYARGLSS